MTAVPKENAAAFFAPPAFVDGIAIGPLTLAGAVSLANVGVDLAQPLLPEKALAAAFVLSGLDDYAALFKRLEGRIKEVSDAVEKCFDDAFSTFLKPKPCKDGPLHLTPHGLGWPLEIAEFLCAEYGWSFEYAARTPVVRAFALVAAARNRNGSGNNGIDYLEREYAEMLKKT